MDVITAAVLILGSGLVSACFSLVGAHFALKRLESRVSPMVDALIVEKSTAFLKLVHEKPEMFKPIVNGLMGDLSKIVQLPDLKAGGMQIGAAGIDAMIPHLPKRYQFPAMIVRMFMGNQSKNESESKSSPFG
jgi:hypothetical protein